MQITVWLAALFFTQNAYTTTGGSVRQAGLVSIGGQRSLAALRLGVLPRTGQNLRRTNSACI